MTQIKCRRFGPKCIALRWVLKDQAALYSIRWQEHRRWFSSIFTLEAAPHIEAVFREFGR